MTRKEKNSDKQELKSKSIEPKVIEKGNKKMSKEKPKIKDNFVAPDGGWGWIIVVAAGFSNFCILPLMQSFGLLFKERFAEKGITSSEITTLTNINNATTAFIGLANGPLFRKFSTRKVGIVGGLICACSIAALSAMESFTGFLIFFSILYGIGIGLTMSSNALTLNTYFKEKRRIATGLSWTCTGMGPIVMPLIITQLMKIYGMEGTVLIYGGLALNAVVCSLFFQPVSWHVRKKVEKNPEGGKIEEKDQKLDYPNNEANKTLLNEEHSKSLENVIRTRKMSLGAEPLSAKQLFGSQYLYYDHEEYGASGIDVMGPGTPMISQANDGWSSKLNASNASLASNRTFKRENSIRSRRPSLSLSREPSLAGLSSPVNRLTNETENNRRKFSNTMESSLVALNETNENGDNDKANNINNIDLDFKNSLSIVATGEESPVKIDEPTKKNTFKYWLKRVGHTIVVFFDLDLLRDPVYVNLMLGITFANFTELNFALLTPFILGEYGFSKLQIATFMSVLGGMDVITRIFIPFIATYIGWENRSMFLLGVSGLAVGRIVLAHVHNFEMSIAVAILMGTGKAMRTIFMALVIPTHVPLSRLPAASGLQLVTSGIVFVCVGPIVGWLRDSLGDYAVTLHCLNIFTYLTVISWTIESWCSKRRRKNFNSQDPQM